MSRTISIWPESQRSSTTSSPTFSISNCSRLSRPARSSTRSSASSSRRKEKRLILACKPSIAAREVAVRILCARAFASATNSGSSCSSDGINTSSEWAKISDSSADNAANCALLSCAFASARPSFGDDLPGVPAAVFSSSTRDISSFIGALSDHDLTSPCKRVKSSSLLPAALVNTRSNASRLRATVRPACLLSHCRRKPPNSSPQGRSCSLPSCAKSSPRPRLSSSQVLPLNACSKRFSKRCCAGSSFGRALSRAFSSRSGNGAAAPADVPAISW
jgi:hypothetical protein